MPSSQFESGFKTILGAKLTADATSMTVAAIPTVTAGRLYLNNGAQEEWISFTGRSGTTITGLTRGLSKTAVPATAGTGLTWIAGTVVTLVEMHDQMPSLTGDNPFSGNNTFTGNNSHSGVETVSGAAAGLIATGAKLGFGLPSLTTAQRLALTPANGYLVYDSDLGENYQYLAGAWSAVSSGSTQPNASTTVSGRSEEGTDSEVFDGTETGGTGARLFVNPGSLYALLKFGGNSSDGVQGDAALTITGSNNTLIEKNFSSWTAGSVSRTCTVTPTNCIVHIKIRGNADFTNRTFNFDGKGGPASTNSIGLIGIVNGAGSISGAAGSGGGGAGYAADGGTGSVNQPGAGGVKSTDYSIAYIQNRKHIRATGGGGGAEGQGGSGTPGAGGGCLIIEVGGNLTFSSTVMSAVGTAGTNGGTYGSGGGGGGTFIVLYSGSLTGTCTPTVTGGIGGTGSTDNGGTGGAGTYLIAKNVTRA